MEVKKPPKNPYVDVEYVGIAVKKTSRNQIHVGILYFDGSTVYLLHLGWHHELHNTVPGNDYSWVDCGLNKISKAILAAYCV